MRFFPTLIFALVLFSVACNKDKKEVTCVMCDELTFEECGVKDDVYDEDEYDDDEYDEDEYEGDEYDEDEWEAYVVEPLIEDPDCRYYTSGLIKYVSSDHKEKDDDEYGHEVLYVSYHADGWATKKKVIYYESCKEKGRGKHSSELVFCCKFKQECKTGGAISKQNMNVDKSMEN